MPGPYVRDTNAPDLTAGVTLNAAGSTTGTAVEVNKPGSVVIEIVTSTVASTGNSATMNVLVEQSGVSNFASDKTKVANFSPISGTDAAQTGKTYRLKTRIDKRYVRVTVTLGGTAPVYTGTTFKVHPRASRDNQSTDSAGT